MLYSYGNEINTNASLYSLLVASPIVASFLPYVEIVCMGLYSVLLVMTVLSLTKGYYKYQVRVRVRVRVRGRVRVRVSPNPTYGLALDGDALQVDELRGLAV